MRIVMIPLTDDAEWVERLAGLAEFVLPRGPVVVVAPHPDDETLGAGALIWTLRDLGVPVTVVAATDGENAYDVPAEERVALGRLREQEQRDALAELGVEGGDIVRLHRTDSGLMQEQEELTERLMRVCEPGVTLLAPWRGDFHPDHEACARAAETVAEAKGLALISYFFWTWHRGRPALLDGLALRRFDAGPEALEAKARALARHGSQLVRADGEPILPERLLAPARWSFEAFVQ